MTAITASQTSSPAQVAVVVGGASGIGASTVRRCLRAGWKVVVGDVNEPKSGTFDGDVAFVRVDITDDASLQQLINVTADRYGVVHHAICTAGITGPTQEGHLLTDDEFSKVIKVDLEGAWRFAKAFITYFRAQEPRNLRNDSAKSEIWKPVLQRGSLTIVASSLGSEGKAFLSSYCAAKHGVIGLSRALALENAEHLIRVNTISPGLCMTPLLAQPGFDFEMAKNVYLADQPMRRFAHPDEIASAIFFTASDKASFMTGSDWGPDGGHHIR